MNIKQLSLFLKEIGVWRADVVANGINFNLTINVPVKRMLEGLRGILRRLFQLVFRTNAK